MNYAKAADKMAMLMMKPKKAKPEPKPREMPQRGSRTATNKSKR